MMKKLVWFLLFNLLLAEAVQAATLTAKVNRNPVPLGETFVLSLEYDGDPGSAQPDLSVLNKDFTVYMVSNSYKGTYINGQARKSYIWNISMSADQSGNFTIPPLKVGAVSSRPIEMKITDLSVATDNSQAASLPKFSVSRTISNPNPLVQQQVNYSFKITTTEALQGNAPQFMMNGQDEWIVRGLGNPVIATRLQNGVEVKEITFNYALFPQKSGDLIIPEVRFDGFYIDPDARRNGSMQRLLSAFSGLEDDAFGLDMFGSRVPVVLKARPISIKVGAVPVQNNGSWWLPAQKAEIYSDWQTKMPEFKSGEAVNREIYLRVTGVIDTQMPTIRFPEIPGVKQYPEKPIVQSDVKDGAVVSIMKINTVYIPEKSGRITIPEIAVDWYNVNTRQPEKAVLPAVSVDVAQGTVIEPEPVVITARENGQSENVMPIESGITKNRGMLPFVLVVVAAFGAGLVISWLLFRPQQQSVKSHSSEAVSETAVSLETAVRGRDLRKIRDNVIIWAKKQYPTAEIRNLDDVAASVNAPVFSEQLHRLQAALYSGRNSDFDPEMFMRLFTGVAKQQKREIRKTVRLLPELYK